MIFYFEPFESQFLNYLLNLLTYTFLYLTIIFLITIYQIRKEDKMNLKRKKNTNPFKINESNIINNHKLNKENELYKFKKNKSSNNMKYIDKKSRKNALNSINELIDLLKEWKNRTSSITIGDLKGKKSNPTPLIWININNKMYKIHTDTTRDGINKFLQNNDNGNELYIILNDRKRFNKVTNDSNKNSIPGLYFYAVDERNGIEMINTN